MGKIKLGKTKDSRTRYKQKVQLQTENQLVLKSILKEERELIDYLLKKGLSNQTALRYVREAERFASWTEAENIPVESAGYGDLLHYIQSHRGKVKQGTISGMINAIKHYYNYLQTTGVIINNPAKNLQIKGIKRRTLYDLLNRQELDKLYEQYKVLEKGQWTNESKRNRVMLGLLISQGLTTTELKQLTVSDVKLREGKVFVVGSRRSNERELKLESYQVLDIMEYSQSIRPALLKQSGRQSEQFFVTAYGGENFSNLMQGLIKQLKKQNNRVVNAKQIRASVIVHWLKNYNLRQVQYMAGHRFVSSTEKYLVNDLDDLMEDVNKYHPIG